MGSDTTVSPGQIIGNYDLLEKIAEGGMGAILQAAGTAQTGQIVAIKVMPPHMANNDVLLKRFEQEFRAASRLEPSQHRPRPGLRRHRHHAVPGDGVRGGRIARPARSSAKAICRKRRPSASSPRWPRGCTGRTSRT